MLDEYITHLFTLYHTMTKTMKIMKIYDRKRLNNVATLDIALTLNVAQFCTTAICRNLNAKCRTLLSAQLCIFSYMCHHVCNSEVGVCI